MKLNTIPKCLNIAKLNYPYYPHALFVFFSFNLQLFYNFRKIQANIKLIIKCAIIYMFIINLSLIIYLLLLQYLQHMLAPYPTSRQPHIFTRQEIQYFLASVCNCTSVILQELPSSTTEEHVIQYLQENRLKDQVRQFVLINPDKLALNFISPQLAFRYYMDYNLSKNFRQSLVNTYLNIKFDQKYLNKLLLLGINERNQKRIFPVVQKFGILKINFICKELNEPDFMAFLSLADAHIFSFDKFYHLKASLYQIGITPKIFRESIMSSRFQVCFNDFLDQGVYKKNQVFLLVWNIIATLRLSFDGAPLVYIESFQCDTNWQIGCPHNKAYARIICSNDSQAKELHEKLVQFIDIYKAGCSILNVKQSTNSYANLLTKNLRIPLNTTEYEFKTIILREYRKVTPQLVNLALYTTYRKRVYHAKIFFANELKGREFLAYYHENLHNLVHYYLYPERIVFQMYIDKQTIYEYDQYLHECRQRSKVKSQKTRIIPPNFYPALNRQYSNLHPYFGLLPLFPPKKMLVISEKKSVVCEEKPAVSEEKPEVKKEEQPSQSFDQK